jgi:hypothetical protein
VSRRALGASAGTFSGTYFTILHQLWGTLAPALERPRRISSHTLPRPHQGEGAEREAGAYP